MNEELREVIKLLEEEAVQLDCWADEMISGSWSTFFVEPMRNRAAMLRVRVNALKAKAAVMAYELRKFGRLLAQL